MLTAIRPIDVPAERYVLGLDVEDAHLVLDADRVLESRIMPSDRVVPGVDKIDGARLAFVHPSIALRLRHPGHPMFSERTLGHHELARDRRLHPRDVAPGRLL